MRSVQKIDRSHLIISDDLPNLQDIFKKSKGSISARRSTKQQNNPQPPKILNVIDTDQAPFRNLRGHKSPSPSIPERLEVSQLNNTEFDNTSVGGSMGGTRKVKTKQDLAMIRKQMMKKKFNP